MSLTKKVGGLRVMKKLSVRWSTNVATPDTWFDFWCAFFEALFKELGFETKANTLSKVRGGDWSQTLMLEHPVMGEYQLVLLRKNREEGGRVLLVRNQTLILETTTLGQHKDQSRELVGNQILEVLRDSWARRGELEVNE